MSAATVNGTPLLYRAVGDGVPCLVMHGGPGVDHSSYHPWLDGLGDVMRLAYYDQRLNGRSGRAQRDFIAHAQLAADADALAGQLGFDTVAVSGHSDGSFIALELAAYDVTGNLGEIRVPTLVLVVTTTSYVRRRRHAAPTKAYRVRSCGSSRAATCTTSRRAAPSSRPCGTDKASTPHGHAPRPNREGACTCLTNSAHEPNRRQPPRG